MTGRHIATRKKGTAAGLALALGLAAVLSAAGEPRRAIAAPASIDVTENRAEHRFAQHVTFTLRAASEATITRVYLFFQAVGDEHTESVEVPIEPAGEITAVYSHDLRLSPLPPFATVAFWWQIDDAGGDRITTDPLRFQYTDNRFRWERLESGGVAVHWIEGQGDPAFGQAALDVARSSVQSIGADLQVTPPPSVDVYIYDAQHNLSAAMVLAGRQWAGGQAHPDLGIIAIAIPNREGYTADMKRDIPHEVTHLLVYQAVTPAGYRYVPEWLDEGLATSNEESPTPEYAIALEGAIEQRRLVPLEDLCVPFPPDAETALLSYAQSRSLVDFARERYGAPALRALLDEYANGASCESGIQQALGISLANLETAWRASLEPQAPWRAWVEPVGTWVGLWLLSLLATLPMVGSLRRRA